MYWDLFGRFIRILIKDKRPETYRVLYVYSDIYINQDKYLTGCQHGMADMGFLADGDMVFPYKRNESTSWIYRSLQNRDIRHKPMLD